MALEQARIFTNPEVDEPLTGPTVLTQPTPTVTTPLSYAQVGQQLFNRELAQPEIGYLQSLYGQDVDPTEMSALQTALNPNQNIQNLYQSVLGRQADPFGGMYWSQAFGSEISPEEEAAFRQAAAPEMAARTQQVAAPSGAPVLGVGRAPLEGETEAYAQEQAGPQSPQVFDTTPDNRIYNGVVYNTVAEADAQRLKDTQEAAGSSSSQAATEAVAKQPTGALSSLQQTFTPGQTLTSGFGNVAEQLGGSGYYKGVAIPRFQEIYDTEQGPGKSVAQQLADWKAGVDKQDLSANAPFGFVETPVYTQPTGDYDAYVSGYQATPATAFDYLLQSNPVIADAILSHTSTGAYAYKVVNGQLKEVPHSEITPEDISQGNAFFMLAGKTGGPDRERMSQLYRADGDNLIPVGDPKLYQGAPKQDMGLAFLDMAASALSFVPGPWQIPAMAYKAIRAAEAGDWSQVAKAFLPAPVATAIDVYEAFNSKDPFRIATALMGTDVLPEVGSFDLGAGVTVKDAVLAAKAVEAINNGQWDVAAIIGGQLSGSSELTAAGQGLRIKNAIDRGDYMGAMTAVQGLSSTINKLTTAPPNLLNEIAFQEANASPQGVGALSPIAAEDEQIALAQRVTKANQAIADYAGPGNDLSREGLVSQLQSFGLTADQAEDYARQADQRINMNRVGADVMNRYSKIDPEFGTPQLDRDTAVQEMVSAGFTSDRANEILNGIDAQNAIKLENKLSVQSAYNNLIKGTGTQEQLRSAMTSAGYTDNEINNFVTKGLGILEGSKLTGGEQAQERASQLPDVRAEIAAKPTFSEAYQLARATYGSNATFTWQGKSYSTATAEERPDLSAAGLAAKALSGDPQFQIALSENAVQNQRNISQVFADYSQKGGDLTREGALSRLESLGVTKDQASFYLDQADGKLPLLFDQFKSRVPTASEDSYRAYILAFNELKNKGVPTSLIDVSGYAASGAKPNYPTFINAISTGFGMGAEAAGNTLKAFGTIGESLGFNTAQMSDFGRRLENIAQELYPQALITSEDEVKARFANAKTGTDLLNAVKDSFINNPGAVAKMIGVEGIQELPNIALALATGGASAVIRYGGMLAGLGLDVVESAGLQGAQKIEEGLSKGLSRADAVKGAVDDMKKAGTVTAIMTAAADKVPFGGTIAKTVIKGSAGEGAEEYLTARWTGASHFDALRQAAFGAMVGGPTEASLQGAGNLTSVVTQGDKMIGTYENGTIVTISEGPKDLIFDVSKPSTLSADIASNLTANLNAGANLSTAINDVVLGSTDLSAAVGGTISGLLNSNVDVGAGISDLTLAASNATGNTGAAIDQVVASLADNKVDLNANAGSVVLGALSSGSSLAEAIDKTLNAVTANGGSIAGSASSIMAAVSGDPSKVANSATAIVQYAINNGADVKASSVIAINASLAANDSGVVKQVVGDIAKLGNNDATTVAITTAVEGGADVLAVVDAAITNGADTKMVVTDTVQAAIKNAQTTKLKTDTKALGDSLLAQGLSQEQIAQTLNGQLAGTNFTVSFKMVDGKPTTNIVETQAVDRRAPKDYSAYSNLFADRSGADAALDRAASNTARAGEQARTFNGTVYPTVEARNEAANAYFASIGIDSTGRSKSEITQNPVSSANLASVVSFLGQMGITPTNSMVEALMKNGPTNAEVLQRIQTNPEILAAVAARSQPAVDTGPVVTGGTGPVVTGGTPVVKAQSDTASRQDVENVLKLMNIPVSNALLNELLSDNATNLQVLQKIQSDPAIQALVQSQRASDIASQADAAINNSVSAAISAGGNTTAAVGAAIDGASTSGSNIVSAVDASVSAAVITNLGTGNNVGSSIETAISGALNSTANNNVGSATVLIAASDAAVSSSLAVGSNPAVVIQAAVDGAVKGDTDLSMAAAVVVSSAVTAGVDPSLASTVVTNVTTNVTSDNGVTIVTSSTDNSTTSVEVSGDTKIVTVVTGNQVVVTETDLDSGTSTQTTTTTSGTNTDTFVHVVPPPLGRTDPLSPEPTGGTPTGTPEGTPEGTPTGTPEGTPTGEVVDTKPTVTIPPTPVKPEQPTKPTSTPSKSAMAASAIPGMVMGSELGRLKGEMLKSGPAGEQIDPLAVMKQRIEDMNAIDPALAAVIAQRLGVEPPQQQMPAYTYGQETSIDDILGMGKKEEPEEEPLYAQGGYVEPLRAAGGAMNPQFMYRTGGLGTREDFRHGKHVAGDGDGQSDDIPAWLADGEFVFPADVVSALGNGSTKAGTDKLYKMMHEIRARARSTKEKDLPPPAHKSPLDYLKKGK